MTRSSESKNSSVPESSKPLSQSSKKQFPFIPVAIGCCGCFLLIILLVVVVVALSGGKGFEWKFDASLNDQQSKAIGTKPTVSSSQNKAGIAAEVESVSEVFSALYYGDLKELITIKNISSTTNQNVIIEVEIPGITERQSKTVALTSAPQTIRIAPELQQNAYNVLTSSRDTTIAISIKQAGTGAILYQEDRPVKVWAIDNIQWVNPETELKQYKYIVRWIDPQNQLVRDFIRDAVQWNNYYCGMNAMIGYQGTTWDVVCQVAALYETMNQTWKVRYVASTEDYSTSSAQKVLRPHQVLQKKQGLCIETTLLMAAALENLGLDVNLMFVPGHVWISVDLGNHTYANVETTLVGSGDAQDALSYGEQNYQNTESRDLTIINVEKAREEGIVPFGASVLNN